MSTGKQKRGEKIHWYWDNFSYSPCGNSTTYYHAVKFNNFKDIPEDKRCKRCYNAYEQHLKGFLSYGMVYPSLVKEDIFHLVLNCKYKNSEYKSIEIETIKFNWTFNIIKDTKECHSLNYASIICGRAEKSSKEQIKYINLLHKLITK